jgi:hypothetical protein
VDGLRTRRAQRSVVAPYLAQAEVADDVVHLGLAEHLVHHHAQLLAAVGKHRVTHRLACAHQALQRKAELLARLGVCLHHGLECRGEQKAVRHAMALQQRKGRLGAEAAVVRHDGPAKVQRGQQRVHQTARPCPVGWRPEHGLAAGGQCTQAIGDGFKRRRKRQLALRTGCKAEQVLAAHKPAEVAHQRTVRNQPALGVACGATGVNQHGWLVGQRVHAGIGVGCPGQRLGPGQQHGAGAVRPVDLGGISQLTAHHKDVPQTRALGTHLQQGFQTGLVTNGHVGPAVLQAVSQCLGPEQHGQRHAHRAGLHHPHVGHGGFKPLRQHNGHPVAALHAQATQHVGQATRVLPQLKIGMRMRPHRLIHQQ